MKIRSLEVSEKREILISLLGVILTLLFILFVKYQLTQEFLDLGEQFKWASIFYFLGFIILLYSFVYSKNSFSKYFSIFLILSLIIFSYPLLSPYNHIFDRDSAYTIQDISILVDSQYHTDEGITGYAENYNSYVGFSFTNAIVSLLTGIPLGKELLFVPFLIQLFGLVTIVYLFLKELFPKEFALIALLIFFISPRLNHIHYESLALFFIFFVFLLLYRFYKTREKKLITPIVLFSICTFITHSLMGYLLLFVLVCYIYSLFIDWKKPEIIILLVASALVLVAFVYTSISSSLSQFFIFFSEAYKSVSSASLSDYLNHAYMGFNFNTLEIFFVLLYFIVIVFILFLGISKKESIPKEFRFSSFISFCLLVLLSLFIFTKGIIIAIREIPLLLIGLMFYFYQSYLILAKKEKKVIIFIVLVFLFIGGNLLSYGAQQRRLFVTEETITSNSDLFVTNEFISAGEWAKNNIPSQTTVIGSDHIFSTIGAYGQLDVDRFANRMIEYLYLGKDIDDESLNSLLKQSSYEYIYFEEQLLLYPSLFSDEPLLEDSLMSLEDNKYLNKVYNTNSLNLFYVNEVF